MKALNALFAAVVVMAGPALAEPITAPPGEYAVEDGMTIVLGSQRIVLRHISAPPLGTSCLMGGKPRDCGLISRASLMDLSAGAAITCTLGSDRLGRCTSGGFDLAENMVYTGWAVPRTGAPKRYWAQMKGAKARKRGFWKASFQPTWPPQQAALAR